MVAGVARPATRAWAPLEDGLVVSVGRHAAGFQHEGILRAGGRVRADHDSGFRPVIGVVDVDHAGDDLAIPTHGLVEIVQVIRRVPDVATGRGERVPGGGVVEGGGAGRAGVAGRAHVLFRGKDTLRARCGTRVLEPGATVGPEVGV